MPLVALLQLAVAAMLCDDRSLSAMAQWGRVRPADDPELLMALGLLADPALNASAGSAGGRDGLA